MGTKIALPVVVCALAGTLSAMQAEFEVVSIKQSVTGFIDLGGGTRLLRGETRCNATGVRTIPGDPLPVPGRGRCVARNSTVKELIDVAYELRFGPIRAVLNDMIIGPSWTDSAAFDVEAKAESPDATWPEVRRMLQAMLAERFRLTFHREPRQLTGFALVVAAAGHKLKAGDPNGKPGFTAAPVVRGQNVPVGAIANLLAQRLGRPVADKTGLTGPFDFTLSWTPDPTDLGVGGPGGGASPAGRDGGSLVTALQEQLGLRLETQRIPVEAFVIDRVEMPTPN